MSRMGDSMIDEEDMEVSVDQDDNTIEDKHIVNDNVAGDGSGRQARR